MKLALTSDGPEPGKTLTGDFCSGSTAASREIIDEAAEGSRLSGTGPISWATTDLRQTPKGGGYALLYRSGWENLFGGEPDESTRKMLDNIGIAGPRSLSFNTLLLIKCTRDALIWGSGRAAAAGLPSQKRNRLQIGNAESRGVSCRLVFGGISVVQLPLQPGLCDPQLSPNLLHRQAKDFGRLLRGHPSEKPHFD